MDVDVFSGQVKAWLAAARHPRWKRPYTDLVYLPMIELLKYMRDNGYKTYIVTGGGWFSRRYHVPLRQGWTAAADQGAQAAAE